MVWTSTHCQITWISMNWVINWLPIFICRDKWRCTNGTEIVCMYMYVVYPYRYTHANVHTLTSGAWCMHTACMYMYVMYRYGSSCGETHVLMCGVDSTCRAPGPMFSLLPAKRRRRAKEEPTLPTKRRRRAKEGPTEIRTRVGGIRTLSDNRLHYRTAFWCVNFVKI